MTILRYLSLNEYLFDITNRNFIAFSLPKLHLLCPVTTTVFLYTHLLIYSLAFFNAETKQYYLPYFKCIAKLFLDFFTIEKIS